MIQTEFTFISCSGRVKPKLDPVSDSLREKRARWNRDWIARNAQSRKEYLSQYLKEYRKKNAAAISERKSVSNKKKLELNRKNGIKRKISNPEKSRETTKKWVKNNPERVFAHYLTRRARVKTRSTQAEIKDANKFAMIIKSSDSFSCRYCGFIFPISSLHIDHIIPVSRGGSHSVDNLAASCKTCNLSKGARLLYSEWIPPIGLL
jgi:5-methylcytosine-specific restriction endonuclease McrA